MSGSKILIAMIELAGAIGVMCAIMGLMAMGVTVMNQSRIDAYQNTPIITAATLAQAPKETPVFIDGHISLENEAIFRNMVTYAIYFYEYENDEDGGGDWVIREYHMEQIWIDLVADGTQQKERIQIANNSYGFEKPSVQYDSEETGGSYRGFAAGDPVTAYGEIIDKEGQLQLQTSWLYSGSAPQYLEDTRTKQDLTWHLGIYSFVFGAIAIAVKSFVTKRYSA